MKYPSYFTVYRPHRLSFVRLRLYWLLHSRRQRIYCGVWHSQKHGEIFWRGTWEYDGWTGWARDLQAHYSCGLSSNLSSSPESTRSCKYFAECKMDAFEWKIDTLSQSSLFGPLWIYLLVVIFSLEIVQINWRLFSLERCEVLGFLLSVKNVWFLSCNISF